MEVDLNVSPPFVVARVAWVSVDQLEFHVDYRNGQTAQVSVAEKLDFDIHRGALIGISSEDQHIDLLPGDVWPEKKWVGVVRLKKPSFALIEIDHSIRQIENPRGEFEVGNTVAGSDYSPEIDVLHESPVHSLISRESDGAGGEDFAQPPSGLRFSDFAGYDEIVQRTRELVELPLENREKFAAIGTKPIKGVLFTGPPGTGKTHLAQIVAAESKASFYMINGPEIFSKWYGQSEELLRKIFAHAASQERSIIFIDEIDSVASGRDTSAHEVSQRVVAQLLTLMDGVSASTNIVVIAATNRAKALDPALRRPGRFDWEIAFPLPTAADRLAILNLGMTKYRTAGEIILKELADETESWSAAEISAIWTEAGIVAIGDHRESISSEDLMIGFERAARHRVRSRSTSSAGLQQ